MRKSKSVNELTIEDLKENPIWEWEIGEEGKASILKKLQFVDKLK
ncbi:hypothetical protein V7068_21280 [Bacillus sp. JJ634]